MATDQIELFLRNALRQKAVEDRLIRQAVKELRASLQTIQQLIGSSSALLGANREASIRSLVAAVARNVQQSWGIPQLRRLQDELAPFLETQLEFARQMVQAAGGTLSAPGAASINAAAVVNNAVVGGRTLGATLTQQLPVLIADRVERYLRLGLLQAAGEVLEVRGFAEGYRDAVVTITTRNVEAVIRSGVHDASSAAQMAIYEVEADPDWLQGSLLWTAVLDSDVCPVCLAMDGTTLKLGEPGRYWDGRNKVSPHYNCVLGGTGIVAGSVAAGVRATYTGDVVTVRTKNGRSLSVTQNHPVLTANGWKKAKDLNEIDQLVCQRLPDVNTVVEPHLNQGPVTAEKLFALLREQSFVERTPMPPSAVDFHRDGAGIKSEIDIARVNSNLLLYGKSPSPKQVGQVAFVDTDVRLTELTGLSSLDALLLAMHATATGLVGVGNLPGALLRGELTPLEGLCLALAARSDTRFDEPLAHRPACNAEMLGDLVFAHASEVEAGDKLRVGVGRLADGHLCISETAPDPRPATAERLGNLFNALPGEIELDDVVAVEVDSRHEVPVYDFSTLSGAYLANGILVHNCRCFAVPANWRRDDMTTPSGDTIPAQRPAEGDSGEQSVSFKRSVRDWLQDNPETTRRIFGKRLGNRLLDPRDRLDLPGAVKIWQAPAN